jgi:uncharacterized protein (DUF1330 family)
MAHVYVVAATWVENETAYDAYKKLAGPSVLQYGGQYVAAAEDIELLSGDSKPNRFAIVRFESREAARKWWDSEEYREARSLRGDVGASQILMVKGK